MDKQMEKLKQKISYQISRKTTLWTIAILSTSGTVSLLFHFSEGLIEKIMLGIGIMFSLFFINASLNCEEEIRRLINEIGKEK